jgi:hypothetical protein
MFWFRKGKSTGFESKIVSRYSKRSIWLFFIILFSSASFAQDFKRQYKNAKDLFDEKNYNLAMEAFRPLIVYDKDNSYAEYASFFYAISAYQQGYRNIAKDMLVQIRKIYPEWDKLDEVNYWLAKIYFDQREYFQALGLLRAVKSPAIEQDMISMERHYIKQIDDAETLKMLLEEHPTNSPAAYAFVKALSGQPLYQQDMRLMDSLIVRFSFNRADFVSKAKPVSVKKDRYRVSLLFPFLAKSLDTSPAMKPNQFVIDLYQGMKLALDTLSAEGIFIDALAYDTERNVEVVKRLLETDELKSTDLIVGPLFSEEAKLVQEFSMQNQINMINPVSNNSGFLGQNPFAMLYQPSYETIASKTAEIAARRIKNKHCMVFFGDAPKDSVTAFSFMKKATELGMKIVLAEEVNKETSARIQPILATATKFDEYKNPIDFILKRDSIGSIFVASEDPLIYTKVVSSVQTRADSTVIFGTESWAFPENTAVNYDTFERLKVVLASPNFSALTNPYYQTFRKKFMRKHGQLPSFYARVGYEFMIFVGKMMHEKGVYFQEGLTQMGYQPGFLGEGFNFQSSRDNQHVPFVQFKGGILTPVR